MMKFKKLLSVILSFVMLFSVIAPVSALEIGDNADIRGVHENRAVVIGKAAENANALVTVLLVEGDGINPSTEDVLYLDTVKADNSGYYEVKFYYEGFEIQSGVVSNCTLKVKAGSADITDTVMSATVNKTDMLAVELKTSLGENDAKAVAEINNLYGVTIDSLVMIAAYDENNKLIGVSMADKIISEENDSVSVTYENVPEKFDRLIAFVWDSAESLIPYATQKDVDYADNDIRALVMHPGADETMRRFAWYNDSLTYGAKIQYALKSDYDADGGFTDENSIEITGTTEVPADNPTSISCKVDIEDLELDTEYVYRVGNKYKYDETVYSFKTFDPINSDKQVFLMVSDLHTNAYTIDSVEESTHVTTYQNYFNNYILPRHPDVQFIASTGDNVSQGNMGSNFVDYMNSDWGIYRQKAELEMEVLFAPDVFKKVPWISTLGNHEADNDGHKYGSVTRWHYNQPNDDGFTGTHYSPELGEPITNGNFWFRNGDVLIVGITAVRHTSDVFKYSQPEDHAKYIKAAIDANKDAKWRVLINHVPAYAYSGGYDEAPLLRQRFADMNIDQFDFDVVFAGHHHNYSRSKQLLTDDDTNYETFTFSGEEINYLIPEVVSDDKIERTEVNGYRVDTVTDPEGTVHFCLPSLAWAMETKKFHPDYANFVEVNGTKEAETTFSNDESVTLTPENVSSKWLTVEDKSNYIAVTVEKAADGSQQMKFELINTVTGEIFDTYVIKKTFAE